jgi:hypothetical protein
MRHSIEAKQTGAGLVACRKIRQCHYERNTNSTKKENYSWFREKCETTKQGDGVEKYLVPSEFKKILKNIGMRNDSGG